MQQSVQQNYFELFNLPVNFDVDESLLKQRFQQVQKQVHPDKHAHASEQQQRIAIQMAAYANDAYQTLNSQLKRAIYILKLNGIELDHRAALDNEFLMLQIEWRESIVEFKSEKNKAELLQLFNQVDINQQEIVSELAKLFKDSCENNLAIAKQNVYKLQFISKFLNELKSALHELKS